jgi:hypothetical protein
MIGILKASLVLAFLLRLGNVNCEVVIPDNHTYDVKHQSLMTRGNK